MKQNRVSRISLCLATALLVAGFAAPGFCKPLKIVASTSTLAYFAEQIGGNRVDVSAVAGGRRDLHYIEALPSYMLKLREADLYLIIGMELDIWWRPLVEGSRNPNLIVVDCSDGIVPLQVPTGDVTPRQGDLHQYGNPHYWLSPDNVPIICRRITASMSAADPENTEHYEAGLTAYLERFRESQTRWEAYREELSSVRFIAYHDSWPYFCEFFGCQATGFIEEFPGVAPSPSHLARLMNRVRAEHIAALVYEPFHDKRIPEMLAQKTGSRAVRLPSSIGGAPGVVSYEDLIDALIAGLLETERQPDE